MKKLSGVNSDRILEIALKEAKEILDVENVIASILLVEDLSRQSN